MKKVLSIVLSLVLLLSLTACGNGTTPTSSQESSSEATQSTQEPKTAKEQLSDRDEQLFNAIVKMTKADFFEPSAIRLLEVGDYDNRTKYITEGTDYILYGPDTVVVRLQGENKVGGTLNHYYKVCIKDGSNTGQNEIELIKNYNILGEIEERLKYDGTVGEYAELEDGYKIEEDASDLFNVGNINRAINEYWENMGF